MATPTKATGRRGRGGAANAARDTTSTDIRAADATRDGARAEGGDARMAAEHTARHNSTRIRVPMLGSVELPAREELAYLGGVGVLAAVGILEWPVAAVLGAGHLLASSRSNRVLREFGEAMETR